MTEIMEYIRPGLLVLAPVLYLIGVIIKHTEKVDNKLIPLILGAVGVVLALVWVLGTNDTAGFKGAMQAVFTGVVQGVLCAGMAVYANQVWKQGIETLTQKSTDREGE